MEWTVHPYFGKSRLRHPEVMLRQAIEALETAEFQETQPNGRIRRWGYVKELGAYVRVVLLEDEETILNAFIDRDYPRRHVK